MNRAVHSSIILNPITSVWGSTQSKLPDAKVRALSDYTLPP